MFACFFHLYQIKDIVSPYVLFGSLILKVPPLSEKKKLQEDIYDNRQKLVVVPPTAFYPC